MPKLPPLNALKAFEASARHLSFTRAADELCVSQGAVSRQVQQLEDAMGTRLLHRTTRHMALTESGEVLYKATQKAFALLMQAHETLLAHPQTVSLQVAPSFAFFRLMPRLLEFERLHPDTTLQLTTQSRPEQASKSLDYFDISILYGEGAWTNRQAQLLSPERLTPVCVPELSDKVRAYLSQNDAPAVPLLHNSTNRQDWGFWCQKAELERIPVDTGMAFETLEQAINATLAGHGVTIGDVALLQPQLQCGSLVCPMPQTVDSGRGYYWVCAPEKWQRPVVVALHQWLTEQHTICTDDRA